MTTVKVQTIQSILQLIYFLILRVIRGPLYTGNQNYEPLRGHKLLHNQAQILKPAIRLNISYFFHMGARPQSATFPQMTCNKYFLVTLINVHIRQSKPRLSL